MKPLILFCILSCISVLTVQLQAQDNANIKFGKVSLEDFNLSKYKFNTDAPAVVIADIGNTSFETNTEGEFLINFKHSKRIKVLNKNGFNAATVYIHLLQIGTKTEKLANFKAATYNIENGKVVETKIESQSVFTDKVNKNIISKKFTFPNVKEGSIIEYTYTQESELLSNLQPWEFQGEYPVLWSEYEINIPEYYKYAFIGQGYQDYFINTSYTTNVHYFINVNAAFGRSGYKTLDGKSLEHRWVMKDVPALKEEKFTTAIKNHISKIEFQLSQYAFPNSPVRDVMGNWTEISNKLMDNEYFGADITKNNGWMDDDIKPITKGTNGNLEKARKIYAYVRDNFTCTEHYAVYKSNSLKTVFKNKNGSVAEINLLLAAMLNHENIPANPVILSTRNHGFANEVYPLMSRFNYLICAANIGNAVYYMDASQPRLGFGHLPDYCYNGYARVINTEHPSPVYFEADSLKEQKVTIVSITNDEKAAGVLDGNFQSLLGLSASYNMREKLGKKQDNELFKEIKSTYPTDVEIQNIKIDSLKQADYPVSIHYNFVFKHAANDDLVYFSPLLSEALKENPFTATERRYPIEMPYSSDETYILNMEIPSGYIVDELPKSAKVVLNDNDGFFEYLAGQDENNIQLRSHIKLNRANFPSDDYASLRDFFGYIVKKQSEQIVFKKRK